MTVSKVAVDLEETWVSVLRAIVDGVRAESSPDEISSVSSLSNSEVDDCLCELERDGWVERWGSAWTLTPFAAEYLGAHLCEEGIAGRVRWSMVPTRERRPSRSKRIETDKHARMLSEVADTSPSAPEIVEAIEEVELFRPRPPFDVDRLPWPTIFLMGCQTTWTERPAAVAVRKRALKSVTRGVCSACKNQPMLSGHYCGRCSRWCHDDLVSAKQRLMRVAK